MRFFPIMAALVFSEGAAAANTPCGGNFSSFVKGLKAEAVAKGHAPGTVDKFFASARIDKKVIKADRAQGVFQMDFTTFARRLISSGRLNTGRSKAKQYDRVFDAIEARYGVSRGVLLAFWAFETDYGGYQGNFNTLNALVTLAHDCRRPHLFRPQIFSALELFERGDFSPTRTSALSVLKLP